MNIDDYSKKALLTLGYGHNYGDVSPTLMAEVLGLAGESGEVAEKFKKIIRDKQGQISPEEKVELIKEFGDILWYINSVAHLLGSSLEEVALENNRKTSSRQKRGVLSGSGDNR